jgi:sulfatase maturation enzyme AslB (radical SAM superfamily)
MDCKFLSNGIAIQYHNFVKPCCVWQGDDAWIDEHQISKVNLVTWHQHKDLVNAREQLANGSWPSSCKGCEEVESQGRKDSIRLGGESAYADFNEQDLTLEIRPGVVCNFACQTCWPFASTRVEQFYKQANIIDIHSDLVKNKFDNYDFLLPIARQLKSIVILGGEPFYDPACLKFIQWAADNTTAELTLFTNGSVLNIELLKLLNRKITLVFSLDAVGTPAEYIRVGTDWPVVLANFNLARQLPNVEVRVNITTSVYNFYYFTDVIDMLIPDWPAVVSFGNAIEAEGLYSEKVIPLDHRGVIISKLESCVQRIQTANIESGQKSNTLNAVNSIINNLKTLPYDVETHNKFKEFVGKMDQVKKIKLSDYCVDIATLLE